ncbi:MAG: hypothetical protein RLZZ144_859, partial [Pseudomonadota bacterium]
MSHTFKLSIILAAALAANNAVASCGSTACSINTNWDEHSASQPGLTVDLRISTSTADTLRSGSNKISADTTNAGEVENLSTVNRMITAVADYTVDEHWGVAVNVPYISRTHSHNLGPYDVNGVSAGTETFDAKSLGDIKAVARYRWELNENNGVGVKFGVKLNTGRKDFTLNTGVLPTEVTLQPGNGSTDLIVGAFWQNAEKGAALSWFAQGLWQQSVANDPLFKPGYQLNIDLGARYAINRTLSGLLQINGQLNGQDAGDNAAADASGVAGSSTGVKIISLTPGVSLAVLPDTNVYALMQLPI